MTRTKYAVQIAALFVALFVGSAVVAYTGGSGSLPLESFLRVTAIIAFCVISSGRLQSLGAPKWLTYVAWLPIVNIGVLVCGLTMKSRVPSRDALSS